MARLTASVYLGALLAAKGVIGLPQALPTTSASTTTTSTSTEAATTSPVVSSSASGSVTSAGTPTVATAIPTPVLPADSLLPSQAALPPKQAWCPSNIFCAGPLLQTVNLAQLYGDSKTFVDKPTVYSADATLSTFYNIVNNTNSSQPATIGSLTTFVTQNFKGEGLELEAIASENATTPAFLASNSTISDPLVHAWSSIVNGYWGDLIRETNAVTLCPNNPSGCESSLIPLNHTFVVPGGRFREQYYWDSFWIMEGLLESELFAVANSTLQNFMDEIERFGFIPNGGRIYYLNRSQPPVFIHMLSRYVNATSDTSILARALPLAEAELQWWQTNRTISVTSPYTNTTYQVSHYAVNNTAPRPESYLEDYETVNGAGTPTNYTDVEKAELYSELASGAESGWDYSSRWAKDPFSTINNVTDQEPLLRGLKVKSTIAVDLNSILYNAMVLIADLYDLSSSQNNSTSNATLASSHRSDAAQRKAAILDLMWDPEKLAFYDFDLTTGARSGFFSAAHFYPLWNGIFPDEVLADETKAQAMFASVGLVLAQYNGTFPATFIQTGAQWDAPNAWPPHQYIIMQALANVPKNISTLAYPTLGSNVTSWSLVPQNQLGLGPSQLPVQTLASGTAATGDVNWVNGTWTNAGSTPADTNTTEPWNEALGRAMANRYFTSVFCSWYSTGGSIPGLLNQLSPAELNATNSDPSSTGHMYEKFNLLDVDAAGSGGEYTVQAGFGWTNGAVLWTAAKYGNVLASPTCPAIDVSATVTKRGLSYFGKRSKRADGAYIVEVTREINRR